MVLAMLYVVVCINRGEIPAGPAKNYVSFPILRINLIIAGPSVYRILTGNGIDLLTAGPTVYFISARVAKEPVISLAAADGILAISTRYPIITSVAVQPVVAATAIHFVGNSGVFGADKHVLAEGTVDLIRADSGEPSYFLVCTPWWTLAWMGSLGKAAVRV
jgi:hypothetical protein